MRFRMDALHYALLAVVVLLAVYAFGSFKEGAVSHTATSRPLNRTPYKYVRQGQHGSRVGELQGQHSGWDNNQVPLFNMPHMVAITNLHGAVKRQ